MNILAPLAILLLLMTPHESFTQTTEQILIGVRPIKNMSIVGLKYEMSDLILEGYLHSNADYFADVAYRLTFLNHLHGKLGLGFGRLSNSEIASKDLLDNPIFPIGINKPSYDYSISRTYVGISGAISSRWSLSEQLFFDIEWLNASLPVVYYGPSIGKGTVPEDKKFDASLSNWSFLFSLGFKFSSTIRN